MGWVNHLVIAHVWPDVGNTIGNPLTELYINVLYVLAPFGALSIFLLLVNFALAPIGKDRELRLQVEELESEFNNLRSQKARLKIYHDPQRHRVTRPEGTLVVLGVVFEEGSIDTVENVRLKIVDIQSSRGKASNLRMLYQGSHLCLKLSVEKIAERKTAVPRLNKREECEFACILAAKPQPMYALLCDSVVGNRNSLEEKWPSLKRGKYYLTVQVFGLGCSSGRMTFEFWSRGNSFTFKEKQS